MTSKVTKFLVTGALGALLAVGLPGTATAAEAGAASRVQPTSTTTLAPVGFFDRIERARARQCEKRRGFSWNFRTHRCEKDRKRFGRGNGRFGNNNRPLFGDFRR